MKKIIFSFLMLTTIPVLMHSCRKDDDSQTPDPSTTSEAQINATISGMVLDENNAPLQGVNVTAYGLSASTDQNGLFTLKGDVNKKRCVLRFTRTGFMDRSHALIPKSGAVNYVRIVLAGEPPIQTINASAGGTATMSGGASVQFQPHSFVVAGSTTLYQGNVNIKAKSLSPDDPAFGLMIPGGDLSGKDASGNEASLYSYGMVSVIMTGSNGEELQLASGSQATITMPIAASQSGSAPSTIPLWYFDETTSLWMEDGSATRSGNNYVGAVTHFTWWNCDFGGGRANINGRVVDCEGIPLPNVTVTVNGGMTIITDQNGNYSNWIPASLPLTFEVLPQGTIVQGSQVENVAPLVTGQTFTVPDLVVPCGARINGHITGCNGEEIEGGILLTQNGEAFTQVYTTDGFFTMVLTPNETFTLMIYSSSGSINQNITASGAATTVDIGAVQLCNSVVAGSNSYVINGDGYNNLLINLTNYISNYAQYSGIITTCLASGYSVLGVNSSINLSFNGNQPFNANLADSSVLTGVHISLDLPTNCYQPRVGGLPFMFSVTEYGNVGDSVKGTFYGNVYSCQGQTPVYISNGKFAFLRTQ